MGIDTDPGVARLREGSVVAEINAEGAYGQEHEDVPSDLFRPERSIEWDWQEIPDDSREQMQALASKQTVLGNGILSYVVRSEDGSNIPYSKGFFRRMDLPAPQEISVNEQQPVPALAALPDFWHFHVGDSDEYVARQELSRTFDSDNGVLRTVTEHTTAAGQRLQAESFYYLNFDQPDEAVMRMRILPQTEGPFTIEAGIAIPEESSTYTNVVAHPVGTPGRALLTAELATAPDHTLAIGQQVTLFSSEGELQPEPQTGANGVRQVFHLEGQGKVYELAVRAIVHTNKDAAAYLPDALPPADRAAQHLAEAWQPYDDLRQHVEAWKDQRHRHFIHIEGDELADRIIAYDLARIAADAGKTGNPAAGYGAKLGNEEGKGYRGNDFWDTPLFAFGAMTPEQQRSYLLYRYQLEPAARLKAQTTQDVAYRGAWGLWEANEIPSEGVSGEGCPPVLYNSVGKLVEVKSYKESVHISADIAFAVARYVEETGDTEFMAQYGAEMILDAALFLADRATGIEGGNGEIASYHYDHITGPDEYHEDVKDNSYTLLMATYTLNVAHRLLESGTVPEELLGKLGLDEKALALMEDVRAKLVLPFNDEALLFEPFEGWNQLLHVNLNDPEFKGQYQMDAVLQQKHSPNPDQVPKEEWTSTQANPVAIFDVIKQHDTILALVLLGTRVLDLIPAPTKVRLLEEYGSPQAAAQAILVANEKRLFPQTSDGSSLSASTRVLGSLQADVSPDDVYDSFIEVASLDLSSANTHRTQDGLHTANLGASVGIVKRGFLGVEVADGVVQMNPRLPSHWSAIDYVDTYRGQLCHFRVDNRAGTAMIELLEPSDSPLYVSIAGQEVVELSNQKHAVVVWLSHAAVQNGSSIGEGFGDSQDVATGYSFNASPVSA